MILTNGPFNVSRGADITTEGVETVVVIQDRHVCLVLGTDEAWDLMRHLRVAVNGIAAPKKRWWRR